MDWMASEKNNVTQKLVERYGENRVLSICTFKTNGSKETILSTFRGLGLDENKAHYMASLLGSEKTGNWSIFDSYYGNEKKERKPIQAFINEVDKYKEYNLLETMLKLEGLICNRSAHAAATLIFDDNYNESSAMMKTPSGLRTTQFEMRASEAMGNTKYDNLVINATVRIKATMDMLIEDGLMEWQGSLKETFNHYLHPDVLEMEAPEMFDMLYNGECISAFQFEGLVGEQALRLVKPRTFDEICTANTLMRLSTSDSIQPLEKFAIFKKDPSLWYKEVREYGLNDEEIHILEEHLKPMFFLCDTQEALMLLTMDSRISCFDLKQANGARKAVAKKNEKALKEFETNFYNQGLANGCRKVFLDYIWKYCFSIQFG